MASKRKPVRQACAIPPMITVSLPCRVVARQHQAGSAEGTAEAVSRLIG